MRTILLTLLLIQLSLFSYSQTYITTTFAQGMTNLSSYDTQLWDGGTTADDAISSSQNIGFTFNYFGTNYTGFYASTNGWIAFTSPANSDPSNDAIPTAGGTDNIIAPFWDDLVVKDQGSTDKVGYTLSGSAPNRVLTIEWYSMSRYGGSSEYYYFQIKLYETTNIIEFHYGSNSLNGNETVTIGIENNDGSVGYEGPSGSPNISSWPSNNYRFTPNSPSPTFYNIAADNGYTYFDNARSSATPRFTISTPSSFDAINFEINTADDFTGTAYTQTITGLSGVANTHYDLLCDNLSPALPTTNGAVYYVRARASNDGGSTWGSWSSQNWSFTHDIANYGWFQTAQKQFEEGTLTGSFIYNTTNGTIADYLYMNRGSFDVRAATDDGVKECGSWYPSVNYMTIGYQDDNCTGEIYNGTRFPSTPIPNGSDILTATYYLDDNDNCPSYDAATVSVYVYGYDIDDAPTVSSSLDTYTSTSNTVNWDMSFTYSDDGTHTLSGVDGIVEEIVNRPGWNENNALTLLVNGRAGEVDAGCVSQADNGIITAPRLDGTFTNFPNYWLSPAIEFESFACSPNYQQLVWDADQTYGTVLTQLYYDNGGTPTIIPDADLSGNSAGFATSPVDISALNTTTYSKIYIRTILRYTSTNTNQTPKLNSWGIIADPVASVDVGNDQTICPTTSTTINASGCGTYEWSTGETTASITVTPASTTTYTVTATVGDGDTDIDTIVITVLDQISITASDTVICNGDWIYLYSSSSAAHTWHDSPINVTMAGHENDDTVYVDPTSDTRYILDDDVCNNSDTLYVVVNPDNTISLTSASGTNSQTVCIDNTIINITYSTTEATGATFSGLPAGVTGSWTNDVVTITGTPSASGTFNYTVDLTGGCGNVSATGTIYVNPDNTISLSSATGTDNQTDCINTAITDITYSTTEATGVTFSGLPAGVTGSWASDVVTITGTPSATGTFNYTVDLTGGCGNVSATGTITINPNPVIDSILITDVTVCSAPYNGIIEVYPNGNQYSYDGGVYTTTNHVDTFSVGSHSITLQDANGCTVDSTVTVNSNIGISIDSIVAGTIMCYSGITNITVYDVDAVQYSIDNGTTYQTDSNFANVIVGTYNVMIKDASGCPAAGNITITEPDSIHIELSSTDVSCANAGTATVIATGGTGSLSYLWSNSDTTTTINNLTANTYYITVTDENSCTQTDSIDVNIGNLIGEATATVQNVGCFGESTGNITVGLTLGNAPYTYNWNPSNTDTSTISDLTIGTYDVTITDAFGCTADTSITITQPNKLELIANANNISCYGYNNGAIFLNINEGTSPYSINWSNGTVNSIDSLINLQADTFNIVVTDNNDCTVDTTVIITEPNEITLNTTVTNILCYGNKNGAISITVNNAVNPYTIMWSNSATTDSIGNLSEGQYSVTLTDNNNCSVYDTIKITQPDNISFNENISDITCYGYNNGAISLQVTGATSPYQFNWSNSANTESIDNLAEGKYFVNIIDNNNCNYTDTFIISQPDSLSFITDVNYDNNLGNISIETNGGTPEYVYNWSNSATVNTITNLEGGEYIVTITDANNCADTLYFKIDEIDEIIIPTVITPNADGINDTWNIKNIENIESVEIHIFNRWGDSVYSKSTTGINYANKSEQWDGKYEGKDLPLGTYVYLLIVDDKEYNGTVTIVR